MATTVLLKSKDTRTREELAAFLEHLALRIREGHLKFGDDATGLDVALPETLRVDLQVDESVKPGRRKRELEIEVWWEVDESGAPIEAQGRGLRLA